MTLRKATQLLRGIVSRPAMMNLRDQDVESIIRTIAAATQMDADQIQKDLCNYFDEEMKKEPED